MRTCRAGFTLLELLLVVAVLVAATALLYPSLQSSYGSYKVTAGADAVKAGWTNARAMAIENSRPFRFSVVLNKGNYRIAPDDPAFWTGGNVPDHGTPGNPTVIEKALPRGIKFTQGSSTQGSRDDDDTVLDSGSLGSAQWTTLVVFLPDGTARPGALPEGAVRGDQDMVDVELQSSGARGKVVRLRCLTGNIVVRQKGEEGDK